MHAIRNSSNDRGVAGDGPCVFSAAAGHPHVPAAARAHRARGGDRARDRTPTIVVVGGGFSGTMAAAQTLRRAHEAGMAVKVVLVERRGAIGEGLAYSTREHDPPAECPGRSHERLAGSPGRFRPLGLPPPRRCAAHRLSCLASGTGNTYASRCWTPPIRRVIPSSWTWSSTRSGAWPGTRRGAGWCTWRGKPRCRPMPSS